MTELNQSIAHIPIPERMKHLPISPKGFPVPSFVSWIDGVPDFRIVDMEKLRRAIQYDFCWLCGSPLGRFKCFVIGPMCAVNRTSSEPPSHRDCAEYSVAACPFLRNPRMRRNEADLPAGHRDPAGLFIERNPKVNMIWVTHDYQPIRVDNGLLLKIGHPVEVRFYREGRRATRAEIMESLDTGMPILRDAAATEGHRALDALELQYRKALELIPTA